MTTITWAGRLTPDDTGLVGQITDSARAYTIALTATRQADGSYVLAGKPEPLEWADWKLPGDEG